MSTIKERLEEIARIYGLSIRSLEAECQLKRGNISNMADNSSIGTDKLTKIIDRFPDISIQWLLKGEGEPIKRQEVDNIPEGGIPISKVKMKALPLVPYEAAAGILKGGVEGVRLKDCEHVLVPFFTDADFLITISGDSMQPSFNSGDLAACKFTPAFDLFFQWGKPYIIATEEGILLKRIYNDKEKELVSFVSDNERYPPIPFPREQIYQVARVLGVVRRD